MCLLEYFSYAYLHGYVYPCGMLLVGLVWKCLITGNNTIDLFHMQCASTYALVCMHMLSDFTCRILLSDHIWCFSCLKFNVDNVMYVSIMDGSPEKFVVSNKDHLVFTVFLAQ